MLKKFIYKIFKLNKLIQLVVWDHYYVRKVNLVLNLQEINQLQSLKHQFHRITIKYQNRITCRNI